MSNQHSLGCDQPLDRSGHDHGHNDAFNIVLRLKVQVVIMLCYNFTLKQSQPAGNEVTPMYALL